MDFKDIVFNAARDGKLYRLNVFFVHKPREEISFSVSARTNGSTPLVMACMNGHLDVAIYLIEKYHADIEQVGSVTFDGETIKGAPPLWCAAAAGHLNIVKMLINCKASVNSTTKTISTPLLAACFGDHYNIVKYLVEHGADIELANKYGDTCLMITCKKRYNIITKYLLRSGADVNRKSMKGNTALHDCAESGSLNMLKMLLGNGAKSDCNSYGTTPLLSAAIAGHLHIVEYFINEFNCTKQEKVNALELLGATFMDKKHDMIMALECWKRAMGLRYEDGIPPLEKPISRSPIASYVNVTEVRNFYQLENLISDPDEMMMQSLLVRERILGPSHPDTVHCLKYRGSIYAHNGNFDRCIRLWMYALDVQQKVQEPLSPVTQRSLLAFIDLFSYMISQRRSFITFQDILRVFQRALKEIETALYVSTTQKDNNGTRRFYCTLIIAMDLVGLMCTLQPHLSKNEDIELKKAAYKLVHLNPKAKNGWTPLHVACFNDSSLRRYPVFTFPSCEVVKLLLEVGASPNVVDMANNTPLHIAAMSKPCAQAIFETLLKNGAHVDLCNHEKKTPLQLAETTPFLDIYPLRYINLQCLCAQTIRKHEVAYEGFVHEKCKKFLDSH